MTRIPYKEGFGTYKIQLIRKLKPEIIRCVSGLLKCLMLVGKKIPEDYSITLIFELLGMKTFDVKLGPEFMFICLYKYLDIIYKYFLLMMVLMYV